MAQQPTRPLLTEALTNLGLPTPHPLFLAPILSPGPSQRVPPLAALAATAKHRLLFSDLTCPNILSPTTSSLPPRLFDASIPSLVLHTDIPMQVLEVEDLSRSKWEQIEALEMERKGEMTKGREVIRVTAADDDAQTSTQIPANSGVRSMGPFKILMQDFKGNTVYGFELKRVEKIDYPPGMHIGCKVILKRGSKIARGCVLLEPGMVVVLGGKIEELDIKWREGREKALREAVGERREGAMELD